MLSCCYGSADISPPPLFPSFLSHSVLFLCAFVVCNVVFVCVCCLSCVCACVVSVVCHGVCVRVLSPLCVCCVVCGALCVLRCVCCVVRVASCVLRCVCCVMGLARNRRQNLNASTRDLPAPAYSFSHLCAAVPFAL